MVIEYQGERYPVKKPNVFKLYLNGRFYGSGDLPYMNELIADYLVKNGMYGKDKMDFSVERQTDYSFRPTDKEALQE